MESGNKAYRERALNLKQLGYESYDSYLRGDIWRSLRAFVLKQNPMCFACGKTATQVHHTNYSLAVLQGKSDRGLYATCGGCHRGAEFRNDGKKLNPKQATVKLKQFRTWREKRKRKFVDWFTGSGD